MVREITWQSILGGVVVAAIIAGCYPYVVLKLGQGPDASMLSAFLGAVFLGVFARASRGANKLQNNVIQTIAGSATATAFMCVVMAAFSYLGKNWSLDTGIHPTTWQIVSWLTCSGCIGVLIVVRFRRFFLDHPRMRFPGGVAAAEVINVLDGGNEEARKKMRFLGVASAGGAVVSAVRDAFGLIPELVINKAFKVGLPFDTLAFGTGMLLSLNVGLSGLCGAVVVWLLGPTLVGHVGLDIVRQSIAPEHAERCMAILATSVTPETEAFFGERCAMAKDFVAGRHFGIGMLWWMWPATAFMITGAITSITMAFRAQRSRPAAKVKKPEEAGGDAARRELDVPFRVTLIGVVAFTILLAIVQQMNFGVAWEKTFVSVVAMILLILAGVWVLGETNSGPVSLMANAVQGVFGMIWRHDVGGNLVAAGMAGDGNAQGEQVMQTYKTGRLVGSTPRLLTYAQLLGVPIGALAVGVMYPILVSAYGIGGETGLSAPTGLKLANMAVLIDRGARAFPPGALLATAIAAALGVLFEGLRGLERDGPGGDRVARFPWVPSAAALGFGLILPPSLNILLAMGAVFSFVWSKRWPRTHALYFQTIAAGLVAGEALVGGLVLPILATLGLL